MNAIDSPKTGVAKRVASMLLAVALAAVMLPMAPAAFLEALGIEAPAYAATVSATAAFPSNSNVTWTLYSDGSLVIAGSGVVSDSANGGLWSAYSSSITGVTMASTVCPTTMRNWFYGCSKLTSVDASTWDTSKVTSMGGMFLNCSALTSLSVSNWETSKVTKMGGMLYR